ncbi:MAG TPA: TIM-barrel domain-containing protein, partial [Verrucomicrobiae bacterium]|nr:TIM-barrel domain-containing protein [Verrucomicrobiae bacterium]
THIAAGFAYHYQQLDRFQFTLNSATTYTFTDLATSASFNGTLSGAAISQVAFVRANGPAAPSNGQDFRFNTLTVTAPLEFDGSSLAYEGFSYGLGAVASQNGGFGWGDTWTNVAGNAMYFDLGNLFGYSNAPAGFDAHSQGNALRGYGGSRVGRLLDCTANGFFGQNGFVDANGNIGANGKTIYVSFLQQPAVTSKFYEFEFHRGNYGDPGRIAGIGNDTAGQNAYFRRPGGAFSSLGAGDTAVDFYVVRIDFKPGNDDVRIYRNPTSLTEPGAATLTLPGVGDMSFDRFCVGAWGNFVAIDEIRVGTTWANVIGLNSPVTGSVEPVAITSSSMIGTGIAEFVPSGFDSNQMPSLTLVAEPESTGALPGNWPLVPQFTLVNSNACASLSVLEGTSLYGGGEVAGPLLRNGQTIELWNTDTAGWSTDNLRRMYQSHPWVLGVRPDGTAFGVIFDSTYKATLVTANDRIDFQTFGPLFRIFVIDRESPQAVLQGLAELTGTISMPPEWALGYHQSRFSYAPASQVQNIANQFLANEIPCDAIWLDIGYMSNNRDFTISSGFPNMPSLTDWLHDRGFHVVPILDPAIAVDPSYSVYQSGTASDLWVQNAARQTYYGNSTPGFSVWPDFTLPSARTWWADLCRDFMGNGMDGLWIDMNEPESHNALTALNNMPYDNWHRGGDGLPPGSHLQYHNTYGMLESAATYQGMMAANPNRRPFVLTRASFLGGQRYAATWTGDNVSSSNNMVVSVPMSLTLGLSGQPFSGPDLGGFIGNATPDLWGNWVGFGAFFPFCRGHATAGSNQKEPWAFGETVENAARVALQRRYRLLPYLYTLFYNASQTGIPVMQPVFFADTTDLNLRAEEQAFMLGSDLLIVPAWAQNPALPKGIWEPVSLVPGDVGQYQAQLKIRGGAIIPVGRVVQNTTQNSFDPLTLLVCLDANGHASGTLYRDAGDGWNFQSGDYCLQTFTAQKSGDVVNVQLEGQQGNFPVANTPITVQVITSNQTFTASGTIESGITVAVADQSGPARAAFDAYNQAFLVRANGQTYYKRSLTDNSYAGTWVQALEIQLAEDAYDRTKSVADQQLVHDLLTTFLAKENYDWSLDTWNDDIAWMTIACVRGYKITGNPDLLNKAISAWNMAYNRGWDSALGGGIWEEMNLKDAKCALSNDPMIVAGCALYEITGETAYLTKCQDIYAWVRTNLFNPTNGQIYECVRSNGVVAVSDNPYNSGAFINAANCLHNLTGDTNYFNDALLAASHVINNTAILADGGRGDSSWADQFARGLSYFARDNNLWGLYQSWMSTNANAAWNARRTDLNITWNDWKTQTPTDNCYSLECLSAAVIQQLLPTTTGAPVFILQPTDQITARGNAVVLSAIATNGNPVFYQWFHANQPLSGATNTNLVLISVTDSDAGNYWVVASNSVASAYSEIAEVILLPVTNGILAQDSATNYTGTGFTGNQGFGFRPWNLDTSGGGSYISGDSPALFAIWNNTASGQSTASRDFILPLPVGSSFEVQLQMNHLDTSANRNGFSLQDTNGNTLFSYWHQGGDNANGHFLDANTSNGTAVGFAYDFGHVDDFKFTLNSATTYTFADLSTGKSFDGALSGGAIGRVVFFRINGATIPSDGQDFKFSNLTIQTAPMIPTPSRIAVENTVQGWSVRFATTPGHTYRIQRADNLNGPWTDIGTLVGPQTGVSLFIDTNAFSVRSFYRTVTP